MDNSPGVSTWEVLQNFGFQPDDTVISDHGPGISFIYGTFKLCASRVLGRWFREVVLFTGSVFTARTMSDIEFEMPVSVPSEEFCAAFIVGHLDRALKIPSEQCRWIALGREFIAFQEQTRREKAALDQKNTHSCIVQRDWMKLALRSLNGLLAKCQGLETVRFSFDGRILAMTCFEQVISVSATGTAWPDEYELPVSVLRDHLPKRLMNAYVQVSILYERLSIDRCYYSGLKCVQPQKQ